MSFNVNYLAGTFNGLIPLNKDSWLKPGKSGIADRYINGIPVYNKNRFSTAMFTSNLFEAYWTVRSFEVNFAIQLISMADPVANFVQGGGTLGGAGIFAGLSEVEKAQGDNLFYFVKGHTKTYHRYYKTIKQIKDNKESLEVDKQADPNPKEGFIYKPNEGTLVSPGPVHSFNKRGLNIKIDFSDIIYRRNLYYPNISISLSTSKFTLSTDNTGGRLFYIEFMGSRIPVFIKETLASQTIQLPPLILFNCTIKPGDRCCDRYYWDGKDKEREEDCESCNDNDSLSNSSTEEALELDGVYLKPQKK